MTGKRDAGGGTSGGEAAEFSSPACSMREAQDVYMGYAGKQELTGFLNELIEAEGAVVKKLRELLPRVRDQALHAALAEMLESHETNIDRVSRLR
jgi:uncharacterized protein DUF6306